MRIRVYVVLLVALACATTSVLALSQEQLGAIGRKAHKSALYAPRPEYPYAARVLKLKGSGIMVLRIEVKTGRVLEVIVGRSTGYTLLDQAAVQTYKKWRFKPYTVPPIDSIAPELHKPHGKEQAYLKVPVSFELRR